jgi:hypothetical protein
MTNTLRESAMTVPSANVELALAAIRDADLPHPDGELLECFIDQAVDPEKAASYLLEKCPTDQHHAGLTAFLSEWIELVSACKPSSSCITRCAS